MWLFQVTSIQQRSICLVFYDSTKSDNKMSTYPFPLYFTSRKSQICQTCVQDQKKHKIRHFWGHYVFISSKGEHLKNYTGGHFLWHIWRVIRHVFIMFSTHLGFVAYEYISIWMRNHCLRRGKHLWNWILFLAKHMGTKRRCHMYKFILPSIFLIF